MIIITSGNYRMEVCSLISLVLLVVTLILALKFLLQCPKPSNLPPCPPSLPIIGHLHYLKEPLVHRTLLDLSHKYGPVMSLRFGPRLVVVVSAWAAAEECFTTNDAVLANRPGSLLVKTINYNGLSVMGAPYGDHWRRMRRFSALEIFSTHRLDSFASVRKEEIERLLKNLARVATEDQFVSVKMRPVFEELPFAILMRVLVGKKYDGEDQTNIEEAKQFHEIISDLIKISRVAYPGDFFPILRWFDYKGYEKRLVRIMQRADKFLQGLLDERRGKMSMLMTTDTVVDHLLSLQGLEPQDYTDEIIKAQILIFLIAGTDAISIPLEWALSNLVDRPDVLEKAKAEIISQTGCGRIINETDIPHLHYLQNIISETLRLFPPIPLLLPHMSSEECFIGGYRIPQNTTIMVNAWAIHRDPMNWQRPTRFEPERFENRGEDEMKNVSMMLPFGLGRRGCPGAVLANRVIGLTLGSLIQCFDWKSGSPEGCEVDMTEIAQGPTTPKAEPLVAKLRARQIMRKLQVFV